jgi:glycosyltransferase involved in cell wall biosynthesis
VGPYEVDFKNIPAALKGTAIAKKIWDLPIQLIRVSQFPLGNDEKKLMAPDEYHFHVPHNRMGDLYRSADLFLSLSKEAEGFGLPALEAMACGIPTILSGISSYYSFDEIRDYALFVDPPGPEQAALAVKRIASEPALRQHLSERGLTVAGQFTKEKVLQRLTDTFDKILHGT